MSMPNIPQLTIAYKPSTVRPRFPTIKAAAGLVYRRLNIEKSGLARVGAVRKIEDELHFLIADLEQWSRNYKKSSGRKAVVDDFLRGHADEIHEILTALDTALANLEQRAWTNDQVRFLQNYRLNLADARALDFSQDDAPVAAETLPAIVAADAWDLIAALDKALLTGSLANQFGGAA